MLELVLAVVLLVIVLLAVIVWGGNLASQDQGMLTERKHPPGALRPRGLRQSSSSEQPVAVVRQAADERPPVFRIPVDAPPISRPARAARARGGEDRVL